MSRGLDPRSGVETLAGTVESPTRDPDITAKARSRWSSRWRLITGWQLLLVGMIGVYVAYFTKLSLDIHHGLGTSSYDFGLYDQGVWLLSRFQSPFVTLMGRNLFGDHTSFILLFVVPIYWLFPAAGTLFFVQSLVIGLGAIPVFLYSRAKMASEAIGVILAGAYLLHPAVGWTNIENFHPDAFLGVLVGMAILAALFRRWHWYGLLVVLSLLVKEDVSLVLVPLGIWVALKRDRRIGMLTVVGSVAFMVVAMYAIVRTLIGVPTRNAWRVPFGGPSGFLTTAIERPGDVVDHLRADGRPWYVWQMLVPTAFVFLRRPSVALIGFVVLTANVVSTFWYQYHINYHYSLVIVPALTLGTAYAIAALGPVLRIYAVGAVGIFSLYTAFLWGPLPFSRNELAYWSPDNPVAEQLREVIEIIPDDAAVSAFHSATAHLTHRASIYQFPNPFRIVLFGPDTTLEGTRDEVRSEQIEYVVIPVNRDEEVSEDWTAIEDAFELVEANESWEVYRRAGPLPPPET